MSQIEACIPLFPLQTVLFPQGPLPLRVFEQRYIENRSTREIASSMGKSPQAIKISLFRTRRTLAEHNRKLPSVLSA